MDTKREQEPVARAGGESRQALPFEPSVWPGAVDVVGVVPKDIRVDPYITEGHPGYDETGPSEIISGQRLAAAPAAGSMEAGPKPGVTRKPGPSEVAVALAPREYDYLSRLVDRAFGEARVEARRTHYNLEYRQGVLEEEQLLRGLIEKFRRAG